MSKSQAKCFLSGTLAILAYTGSLIESFLAPRARNKLNRRSNPYYSRHAAA